MKIDILTIFPEMFDGFLKTSIIKHSWNIGACKIFLDVLVKMLLLKLLSKLASKIFIRKKII